LVWPDVLQSGIIFSMGKYRLYVDESGTSNYPTNPETEDVNRRYLALTGFAITEDEMVGNLSDRIRRLKYSLTGDYDEKFTLHRDEIKDRRGTYEKLRDKEFEKRWNDEVIRLFGETAYVLFTVVVDKVEYRKKYDNPNRPYYYCIELLVERYARYLESVDGKGDIMAEARGKNEDADLGHRYRALYENGNHGNSPQYFQKRLTTNSIKFRPKNSIEGLELADLLVLASKLDVLKTYGKISHVASGFNKLIIDAIQDKYYRKGRVIKGHGKILVP